MSLDNIRFIFFGTPDIAVTALDELYAQDLLPCAIVTAPDAPRGRGLQMFPSPVSMWAEKHALPVHKPTSLRDPSFLETMRDLQPEVYVVVAYGKILPKELLSIPKFGGLNMHPSLLPKHRGPSPIESQILKEQTAENVGVTIMLLDELMDHGPILAQESVADSVVSWPIPASQLRPKLAQVGAKLLTRVLPEYLQNSITPIPQNDKDATFCHIIKKEDALIDLADDPYTNYLKILAYDVWPRAFFYTNKGERKIRVIITGATYKNDTLTITHIIPEGKREMTYKEFLN